MEIIQKRVNESKFSTGGDNLTGRRTAAAWLVVGLIGFMMVPPPCDLPSNFGNRAQTIQQNVSVARQDPDVTMMLKATQFGLTLVANG